MSIFSCWRLESIINTRDFKVSRGLKIDQICRISWMLTMDVFTILRGGLFSDSKGAFDFDSYKSTNLARCVFILSWKQFTYHTFTKALNWVSGIWFKNEIVLDSKILHNRLFHSKSNNRYFLHSFIGSIRPNKIFLKVSLIIKIDAMFKKGCVHNFAYYFLYSFRSPPLLSPTPKSDIYLG